MADLTANIDQMAADGPALLFINPTSNGATLVNITANQPWTPELLASMTDRDRALLAALLGLAHKRLIDLNESNPTTTKETRNG